MVWDMGLLQFIWGGTKYHYVSTSRKNETSKHLSGKYQPHTQALELLQRRSSATAAQEGSEKVGSICVVDAHVSYATISVFTKLCRCQKCMIVQVEYYA